VRSPSGPNLEGLDDLARRKGVDTRPTLLRVLTDLYVQRPAHTLEEERHYTELALRLLDGVDTQTRAVVAQKLAAYPAAPATLVRRLARDTIEVADSILRHSASLDASELTALVEDCGPEHGAVVAARGADRPEMPAVSSARLPPAYRSADALLSRATDARRVHPASSTVSAEVLAEVFFTASSGERRALLADLDGNDDLAAAELSPSADAVQRLEITALARKTDEFVYELAEALGLSSHTARRIVEDAAGEPLLVAAKALDMPSAVLNRILLFLNPAIGQSVPRVFDLARFYLEITPSAALRLVGSLRSAAAMRPAHQPALWNDESDSGWRTGLEAARRALRSSTQPRPRESLVSRFRSSSAFAAPSVRTSESKGH